MRASILLLLLGACADSPVSGSASSTAHPTARSAIASVVNVDLLQPAGTYRLWTIDIVEDEPGTPCEQTGAPLVTIEIYTIFSSAPRGRIPLSMDQPPPVFPAAYATVSDGFNVQGDVTITAAATSKLIGELNGYANIGGMIRELDLVYEAPTCGP